MEASRSTVRYLFVILALAILAACEKTQRPIITTAAVKVTVSTVLEQPVNEWDEFTAHLEAPETVDVRPRVSGQIDKVAFVDGALIEKGELLFQIDPRSFEYEVLRLEAKLQQVRATASRTKSEALRGARLLTSNAISSELSESRNTASKEAQAVVDSVTAQLNLARLNLSFTRVVAPISGRVSRAEITAGNIVTSNTSTLTHVVSIDKMYAYFDADERVFLKYNQLALYGQRGQNTPVYMGLSNEDGERHLGRMNFVDNHVNPKTGTIRGRAVFDNREGLYTAGLYARLRLVGSNIYSALLIKDEAVGTDLGKKFVLVVDKNNYAVYRTVELGPMLEGLRIVRDGLRKDDRIVVSGLQRVRPGAQVDATETPMASEETLAALANQRNLLEASNPAKKNTATEKMANLSPARD
ncbi:RND transporter MFP subunit [Pseudomonas sp. RIT-PI-q]|uniref:efflux RND transporter periplasmic adaptor subunit n=1 Tax=Pseudomonas sp. RIT-PI-q TaxID=1690247 RepID=UPI0006CDBC4A|nr:efflux RND transporter periplasmic adaptor subunit [Pseudomonas sp. RIT-PI-q]KPG95998.1 RND transporter MFP subunit [Pseudomonas sp. RIT-PI-q]